MEKFTHLSEIITWNRLEMKSTQELASLLWLQRAMPVANASATMLTSISTIFYLHHSRTGFRETDTIINRVIKLTVGTGLLPSISMVSCFLLVRVNFCSIILGSSLHLQTFLEPNNGTHLVFYHCTISCEYTLNLMWENCTSCLV